ncbi:hypothetical protein Bra5_CH00927 [Rhizobium phaseoli Brasil 5]|nr:hypothetical protein Bra5_CH00927 [Rhizobium phaseoli Brasil 5]
MSSVHGAPKAHRDLSDSLGPRFGSLVLRLSSSQNRCTLLRDKLLSAAVCPCS